MRTRTFLSLAVLAAVAFLALGVATKTLLQVDGMLVASEGGGGFASVLKFGHADAINATEETVYQGNDLVALSPARKFTNEAGGDYTLYISSDAVADADEVVTVEGTDASGDAISVDVTLVTSGGTGTAVTMVGTASNWDRVNRAYHLGAAALAGNVYLHLDATDAGTDGIPDDPANEMITGFVAGEEQTLQAAYSVPAGWTAYVTGWHVSNLASGGTTNPVTIRMRGRSDPANTLRTKSLQSIDKGDHYSRIARPYWKFPEGSDIEMTAQAEAAQNLDIAAEFDVILVAD